MPTDRRPVRLFLSWAHADEGRKKSLLELLSPRLRIDRDLEIHWWEDSDLTPGERWRDRIEEKLAECDFAFQLISPSFIASDFITHHELGPFVGPDASKPCLPVGLEPVPLTGAADLHGLDPLQIFRLDGLCYSELGDRTRRVRFADQLVAQLRRRVLGDTGWRRP